MNFLGKAAVAAICAAAIGAGCAKYSISVDRKTSGDEYVSERVDAIDISGNGGRESITEKSLNSDGKWVYTKRDVELRGVDQLPDYQTELGDFKDFINDLRTQTDNQKLSDLLSKDYAKNKEEFKAELVKYDAQINGLNTKIDGLNSQNSKDAEQIKQLQASLDAARAERSALEKYMQSKENADKPQNK